MTMEEEREYGEGRKLVVASLIDKATNSTKPEIEPRLLKAIKSVVRNSEPELRLAAKTLINLMKQDHSQVRYLTLLIIDELFMRSKLFRTLLVENLDLLLTLSVGFRKNLPLPNPPSVASALRSKAIEFLEKWNASFGIHYRQLRLGFDYMKNTLRFQFPNLQANAARVQQERREREARAKEILLNKFETLKSNYSSIKDKIQSTIDEIGECLDIIKAKDDNLPLAPLDDNDEMEEFRNSELRQIRLDSLKEGEKVHEDSDNKVVFDALRELYKLLLTKHMVSIQDWISVLIRVEVSDNRVRDSILKEFIDIRNLIKSIKSKCEESGCSLVNPTNQNEEDIWEEGVIASLDTNQDKEFGPLIEQITKGFINEAQESSKNRREKRNKGSKVDMKMDIESKTPLKSKLLTEAPVMQWGSFLDNWGTNRDYMANQRGLEFDGHWGRVDSDAVIPAEKIAELNLQLTIYKEEPFEIPECRAPLKKGKFCERRDLKICPFHGPIIPRDDRGKPIKNEGSTDEIGPDLAEKLAKQAVKNVRERDKEDVKKREYEKKVSKRAKLAKVREHNDAVLRVAAMASTSRSSGIFEDEFETVDGVRRSAVKNKKETLASMLKKKVSAKDRLAQRLLNTRAKDATTRQLTLGEDAKYRESFPNQW